MRKGVLCACFCFFMTMCSFGQSDKRLVERLDSVLKMTELSDLDRIMDFTYPKLFTLVPREEILKALREALKSDEFTTTFDSIRTVRIYPVFTVGTGSYAKVTHTMRMNMKFTEEIDTADEEGQELLAGMKADFGPMNVRFEKSTNTIHISMLADMVAVKDEYAREWSFANMDEKEDSELAALLFSDEVLKKLRTFQ